jgi:hypothetical protein
MEAPKPKRGRPLGSTAKPKEPTKAKQRTIETEAGKKYGAPRKDKAKKPTPRAKLRPDGNGHRASGRFVAAGMLACASHMIQDMCIPPVAITKAFQAAMAPPVTNDVPTTDTALPYTVTGWDVTNADGTPLDTGMARVYRELGIDAAAKTPGGPAAVRKELDKYLGTRSLGKPVARSTLHNTSLVYKAKLLFGQKAVETDEPTAKARLVVGGHLGFTPDGRVAVRHDRKAETKVHGDYWTPGASLAAVRYMCSHAALHGHVLSSRDLSQAYLQTVTTEKQSFISLPLNSDMIGYFPTDVRNDIQALRDAGVADKDILFPVIASLYGLPSAGYSYWRALEDHLIEHGWTRLASDGGALWSREGCLLCVYVDDLLLSCPVHKHSDTWSKHILGKRWHADPEPIQDITRYLGLYLHKRKTGGYMIEQQEYGQSIVKSYMAMTGESIRPRTTLPQRTMRTPDMPSTFPPDATGHVPDDPNLPVGHRTLFEALQHDGDDPDVPTDYMAQQHDRSAITLAAGAKGKGKSKGKGTKNGKGKGKGKKKINPIHSTVGALMYLSRGSRPDLAWGVQRTAEAIHSWTPDDKEFLEHLLGYIMSHDRGLIYDPLPKGTEISDVRPCAYTDSNYVAPASRSGYLFTLQTINGDHTAGTAFTHVIDWCSRKQRYASLSSSQAETVALQHGVRMLQDSMATINTTMPEIKNVPFVFCDSAPALAAVRRGWSRSLSNCSRALGCAVQWLHDLANADNCRFRWMDGKVNPADSLTKGVGKQKCQLAPMMTTKEENGSWTAPAPRTDGALYVPQSTQPTWSAGVAKCYVCGERRALCHRCKACTLCGCTCTANTEPHPVDKAPATCGEEVALCNRCHGCEVCGCACSESVTTCPVAAPSSEPQPEQKFINNPSSITPADPSSCSPSPTQLLIPTFADDRHDHPEHGGNDGRTDDHVKQIIGKQASAITFGGY